MTPLTKREQRHEQTKQGILNTALNLIVTKGVDKLSLREIARTVGYKSPAGLYEYFDGKDDIIDAVCIEADSRFLSTMQSVESSLPARDYLIALGMAYIRFARENPQEFKFLFDNQMIDVTEEELYDAILPNVNDTFGIAYHGVQRCIDEGLIILGDRTALDITYCLWALLHGCAMLQTRYLKSFPMDFERVDRHAIVTLLKGFGVRE